MYLRSTVADLTVGVSGSRQEGFGTLQEANDAFHSAQKKGEVYQVNAFGTRLASGSAPSCVKR